MRLEYLRVRNYCLLEDAEVTFPDGIIGLTGPNGSGKTTMLTAIQFATYGVSAVESTLEELVGSSGPDASVELGFALGDQHFLVRRRVLREGADSKATLFVDDAQIDPDQADEKLAPNGSKVSGPKLIATGSDPVTAALVEKIGGFKEAKISRFVAQDQLNELSSLKPADRKRLILHLLGIDAVEVAIASLRRQVLDHDKSARERRSLLPDRGTIETELKALAAREKVLGKEQIAADKVAETSAKDARSAEEELALLEHKASASAQQSATLGELDEALTEIDEREIELDRRDTRLAGVAERLTETEGRRTAAEARRPEYDAAEAASALRGTLRELTKQADELRGKVAAGEVRQRTLRETAGAEDEIVARLATLAHDREKFIESATLAERERAELVTAFERNRDKQHGFSADLATGAANGICGTCGGPVEPAEYARHIEEQLAIAKAAATDIVEAGKLAKVRLDGASAGRAKVESEIAALEARLVQARAAAQELRLLEPELTNRREQAASVSAQIAEAQAIPYDESAHAELVDAIASIRTLEGLISGYRGELAERATLEAERARLVTRRAELLERAAGVRASLIAAGYDPDAHERARVATESARETATAARLEVTRLVGEVARVSDGLARNREREADYDRMRSEINVILSERGEIEQTREAMDRFKIVLIGRIRPLLSHKSSDLLRDLTAGRYSELTLDSDYEMHYGIAGSVKPIRRASGGERNLMNLCLRLAVSELINETTGIGRTFLTLDEVLGSQDDDRRESIVTALPKLAAHFGQVLMVAHNHEVQDLFEHVIRFHYDRATDRTEVRFPEDERLAAGLRLHPATVLTPADAQGDQEAAPAPKPKAKSPKAALKRQPRVSAPRN
jgi:exonuclease SbcC